MKQSSIPVRKASPQKLVILSEAKDLLFIVHCERY